MFFMAHVNSLITKPTGDVHLPHSVGCSPALAFRAAQRLPCRTSHQTPCSQWQLQLRLVLPPTQHWGPSSRFTRQLLHREETFVLTQRNCWPCQDFRLTIRPRTRSLHCLELREDGGRSIRELGHGYLEAPSPWGHSHWQTCPGEPLAPRNSSRKGERGWDCYFTLSKAIKRKADPHNLQGGNGTPFKILTLVS